MGDAYKALLHGANAQLSHSRRGECYDNAQVESLWSRLKTEVLEARDCRLFRFSGCPGQRRRVF